MIDETHTTDVHFSRVAQLPGVTPAAPDTRSNRRFAGTRSGDVRTAGQILRVEAEQTHTRPIGGAEARGPGIIGSAWMAFPGSRACPLRWIFSVARDRESLWDKLPSMCKSFATTSDHRCGALCLLSKSS
jgi:hypothetical protein